MKLGDVIYYVFGWGLAFAIMVSIATIIVVTL